MIKSLAIHNFQSHEKSYLKFHPGVNVIVGSSDSGKTAIIRALRWIVWNRPSGDAIRSYWGGDTFAILETEDGFVWRHKGKIDKYELKAYDKNSLVFKAFGTSVPEEISKFLNINEINLQMQLDSPFLLSNSSGEVAQYFNRVARLDKIDTGLANVNKWIRELEGSIKYNGEQIKSLGEELSQFDYLDNFEIDVEAMEALDKVCLSKVQAKTRLDNLIRSLEDKDREIEEASTILKIEIDLDNILGRIADREDLRNKIMHISTLLENIDGTDRIIEREQSVADMEEEVTRLILLGDTRRQKQKDRSALYLLVKNIDEIEEEITQAEQRYETLHKQFEDNFPDICPLCEQEVKHDK